MASVPVWGGGAPPAAMPSQAAPADSLTAHLTEVYELLGKGQYQSAEERLVTHFDPHSLRLRMELALRKGDQAAADRLANQLLELHQRGVLRTAAEKAQAAYAAWQLDRWHEANEIYMESAKLDSVPVSLYVDWGNLYLEKYNPAEAQAIFQDALRSSVQTSPPERWGLDAAYVGLARALEELAQPGVEPALEKAKELNSQSLELMTYRVLASIRESAWEEADEWLEKGFQINKQLLPLLELKAAFHYFQGQAKAFEKAVNRVLEINPTDGGLFETLGDLCVPRRRLDEAIDFYRRAVEKNPRQWSALASLGINLLRVGQEVEGKQTLERAFANDPFNIWSLNTLRLLDSLEDFARFETRHFSVKVPADELGALRPYVEQLLEESLTHLSGRYAHNVDERYIFEMYDNHDDFAVRTLGLPGLGALGATFGKVVAMDSPSARPVGKFHWGSTLWHEVAHVVTLSLSGQKVPRWLTEGISMMEERLARQGWGDFLTPAFVKAYEEDKLLSLGELNSGFERPRFAGQLQLSYFQAGWVCDFLAENYGIDKIRSLLVAFGEGRTMEDAFEEVFDASVETIDGEFRREMDQTLKPLVAKLKAPDKIDVASPELQLAALRQAVQEQPESYYLNLTLGRHLADAEEKEEAVVYLTKALELFPYLADEGSPYPLLAKIYRDADRKEELMEILRRWWHVAPRFAEVGTELAEGLIEREHVEAATEILEDVMYVDPLKPKPHQMLGDLYLNTERAQEALREFKILLELEPTDIAGAHYRLAQALLLGGDTEAARRQVLLALEIAPTYGAAQKLLLQLVRQ